MADHGERITRDLTVRYVTVLVVLGGLAIASFLGLTRIMSDAESGTALLNLAGRQRMLVERAALAASRLSALAPVFAEERARARRLLADSLDVLESSHLGLLDGLPELKGGLPLSEAARALYFGPVGDVDAQLRSFVADGRALLARADEAVAVNDPHVVAMVAAAEGPLLAGLDTVAGLYQTEGRERLVHLSVMHGAALATMLMLLVLSAAFVFGPMTRRIRGDIEDRSRAEKNLRDSELRLRRILEESPVGVSVSRREDGVVVFANARFCEILGAPGSEVIGSVARDHYVDDDQRGRVIHILKTKGRIDDFEVEFRRKDGTPFHSLLTLRPTEFEGEAVNLA
ncbi:MAG: PAS domain-containing protein, partial [Pseudomonadota bacterium]